MTSLIDNRSGVPIYDQIVTKIKRQNLSGALSENEALPSIRSLAKDLRISVITTKRAYDELEGACFIFTVPGKGSFVAAKYMELIREGSLRQIEEHMKQIQLLARACGLSRQELGEIYDVLEEEE